MPIPKQQPGKTGVTASLSQAKKHRNIKRVIYVIVALGIAVIVYGLVSYNVPSVPYMGNKAIGICFGVFGMLLSIFTLLIRSTEDSILKGQNLQPTKDNLQLLRMEIVAVLANAKQGALAS